MSSGGDFNLLRILHQEIEHERPADAFSHDQLRPPPKPFSIIDKPEIQEVSVKRSYGQEDIRVDCVFHAEKYLREDEDDEDGVNPTQIVQMVVKVSKGGANPFLEIGCSTSGDDPVIDRVILKDSTIDPREQPYGGPSFMDLDHNLKKAFVKYLMERGINGQLGSYLLHYMYHKEQLEYSKWLRNIESFIRK